MTPNSWNHKHHHEAWRRTIKLYPEALNTNSKLTYYNGTQTAALTMKHEKDIWNITYIPETKWKILPYMSSNPYSYHRTLTIIPDKDWRVCISVWLDVFRRCGTCGGGSCIWMYLHKYLHTCAWPSHVHYLRWCSTQESAVDASNEKEFWYGTLAWTAVLW